MPEFIQLTPPNEALDTFLSHLIPLDSVENIETHSALGRVLATSIMAPHPLPEFPRSTVDGYALRATDTFGASESLPVYLESIGEVPMGGQPDFKVGPGQCAVIHTGGMLPEGADGIVMVEYTQPASLSQVEIMRAVAVNENIIKIGEDVTEGQEVIPPGTRLRPADIGGLMALGFTQVEVVRQPVVGILSSGDEVIPPTQRPQPGQVRDVNAYTLAALVAEAGGESKMYGIIPDTLDDMRSNAAQAQAACDIVVITAGSSASTRDLTSVVIDSLGSPGVLVHGVNVKPGKPTILAVCDQTAMVGLPGNPVSALVIAGLFVVPAIRKLLGERGVRPVGRVPARLSINLPSQTGREEWVPVRLLPGSEGWLAEPIFGPSNLIFKLSQADGLVHLPADATGLPAGAEVEVTIQ
jgi:molybdopterin molybdotransferase